MDPLALTKVGIISGISACVVLTLAVVYQVKVRTKAKVVGRISELLVYPIKSGPPLRVEKAICTNTGLRYLNALDR